MSTTDEPTFGAPDNAPDFVAGQVIVRVHEHALRPYIGDLYRFEQAALDDLPDSVTAPLDYLASEAGARIVEPVFSERAAELAHVRGSRQLRHRLAVAASVADAPEGLGGVNVVELPQKNITPELLKRLRGSRAIAYAEPAPTRWLQEADPLRNKQWGLRAIRWFDVERPDASEQLVALIDSGIDATHPDLSGVVSSYDTTGFSSADVLGHGTHVGGIIAAATNNSVGISGACNCRLAVWKVTPDTPTAGRFAVETVPFLRALNAVTNSGARVVNLSLGGRRQSRAEQEVLERLAAAGVLAVAAMGNEYLRGNPTEYPGAYPSVLAVGAADESDNRASYSNTGQHIGLVAPGSNILSTVPVKKSKYRQAADYASWSGTSFAVPHVSAAAALLFTRDSGLSPDDARERLCATARKLPGMSGKDWTPACGKGLLDLTAALS